MLDYVYGHDAIVADFVAQLIPRCRERGFPATAKAIGIIEDGALIAGVVYHNYEPEAQVIEISGAALPGKYWVTPETLKRSYSYPFIDCGCQMVVQRNSANDERLLGNLADLNYYFIPIPRMLGRDHDGVLCCLTYENWISNRFNQRLKRQQEKQQQKEAA
jgi:hypothetical protein